MVGRELSDVVETLPSVQYLAAGPAFEVHALKQGWSLDKWHVWPLYHEDGICFQGKPVEVGIKAWDSLKPIEAKEVIPSYVLYSLGYKKGDTIAHLQMFTEEREGAIVCYVGRFPYRSLTKAEWRKIEAETKRLLD